VGEFFYHGIPVMVTMGYITFDVEGAELLLHLLAIRYETLITIIATKLLFYSESDYFMPRR